MAHVFPARFTTNGSGALSWSTPAAGGGGGIGGVLAKSADYTATASDGGKVIVATSPIAVTLPEPGTAGDGYVLRLKSKTASGSVRLISGNVTTQLIDDYKRLELPAKFDYVEVVSDGTQWHILSKTGSVQPLMNISCKAILDTGESSGDGIYAVRPTGYGSDLSVYCDMTNGGWTRLMNLNALTDLPVFSTTITGGTDPSALGVHAAYNWVKGTTVKMCGKTGSLAAFNSGNPVTLEAAIESGITSTAVINTVLINVTGGADSARLAVLGQTTGDYCYFGATAWARNDVDAFDVHKQNNDLYTGSGASCITQDIWIK